MDIKEIYNLIKDVKPGVWKIGVTYKSDLKLLSRGPEAKAARANGITDGDYYKVVFRWCSANVNKKNTKSYQDARKIAIDKAAAAGKTYVPRATGFHKSDDENEFNIIEYRDGSNDPCLVLKHGPNADKAKYYFRDKELTIEEVQDLIDRKVISSTSISKLQPNEVFYLYPEKVQSLKIDGILHEELEEMNEARFNGIILPNEDGIINDMDEELCEEEIASTDEPEITKAMDEEAHSYGYRNYAEYRSDNK